MTGRHRRPTPPAPAVHVAAGATLAALGLLVAAVVTTPARVVHPTAVRAPLTPVAFPLPPLDTATAALYLAPLPATPVTETAPLAKVEAEPKVGTRQVTKPAVAPVTVKAAGATGGLAAKAVSAALAQQGTPYVHGGATPGGFDCSGLVKYAFARAGVTLPRTAAAQATMGRPVSLKDLTPGDVLTFYHPVSHIVLYVGDGQIVEASQPGTSVHVRPLYTTGFAGARRLVG